MKIIDEEYYWVLVSKRHKKLWRPKNKDDFYDVIYSTPEDALDSVSMLDKRYYKPMRVRVRLLQES